MKSNSEIKSIRNKKSRCFRCNRLFYSCFINKNNIWGYWTEKEEDKEKFIHDFCLSGFYRVQKEEMLEEVKDPKKRVMLKNYVIFEAPFKHSW
jgi:hypothetical protein